MALPAGTCIGQYEIVAALGAGGMGEVYRARDRKLGREVAVKVLAENVATDPERLARFEREAQLENFTRANPVYKCVHFCHFSCFCTRVAWGTSIEVNRYSAFRETQNASARGAWGRSSKGFTGVVYRCFPYDK